MELEKQRLLISSLASNRELLALCASMIRPSYFDASLKKSVKFLLDYFEKYRDAPKIEAVRAETGVQLFDVGEVGRAESSYISTELEVHCRNKAIEEAILAGPALLQKGDFSKILETLKSAITVGLQKDIGIDYFHSPQERLLRTLQTEARISTGIAELDELLGGGLARQELILFLANSGGGKSMNMLNLGKNLLAQGLNGAYITLEMAEGVVSKRLDSMISKVGGGNLLKEISKVSTSIENAAKKMGRFIIKRFPESRTTVHDIRSFLTQLEQSQGFRPDFIIVDYIDIMGTTANISYDNLFVKDKYVTEEVRSLGFDYDAIVISASQLGRAAIEAERLTQAHIQGGISKINTSDWALAVVQNDLMRSVGEVYYELLKARNSAGVGRRILLKSDPISLVVSSPTTPSLKVPSPVQIKKSPGDLTDLIDI